MKTLQTTKMLATALAATLTFSAPALAQSVTVLGGYIGGMTVEFGGTNFDAAGVLGLNFSHARDVGSWRGQIDVVGETTGPINYDGTRAFGQLGLHLSPGVISSMKMGGFAAFQIGHQLNAGAGARWMLGLEGSRSNGNGTFFLQAGISNHIYGADDHGEPINAGILRAGARFYLNPSRVVGFDVTGFTAHNNAGDNGDPIAVAMASIYYEQQLSGSSGWSIFANGSMMNDHDFSHSASPVREAEVRIGMRWSPGSGTIQDRDANYAWWGLPETIRHGGYVDSAYAH